jgi:hypothetical protein
MTFAKETNENLIQDSWSSGFNPGPYYAGVCFLRVGGIDKRHLFWKGRLL